MSLEGGRIKESAYEALLSFGSVPMEIFRGMASTLDVLPRIANKRVFLAMLVLSQYLVACADWDYIPKEEDYRNPLELHNAMEEARRNSTPSPEDQALSASVATHQAADVSLPDVRQDGAPYPYSPDGIISGPLPAVVQPGEGVIPALQRAAEEMGTRFIPRTESQLPAGQLQVVEIRRGGHLIALYDWPVVEMTHPRLDIGDELTYRLITLDEIRAMQQNGELSPENTYLNQ